MSEVAHCIRIFVADNTERGKQPQQLIGVEHYVTSNWARLCGIAMKRFHNHHSAGTQRSGYLVYVSACPDVAEDNQVPLRFTPVKVRVARDISGGLPQGAFDTIAV